MGHMSIKKNNTQTQTQEITYVNNTSLHIADKNKNNNDNNTTPIFLGLHKTTKISNIKSATKIHILKNL
jgi:hypothetical protein